jgi:hypothetical protein
MVERLSIKPNDIGTHMEAKEFITAQGKSRRHTKAKLNQALNSQAAELEEVEASQPRAKRKKRPFTDAERKEINPQKEFIDIPVQGWLDIDDLLRVVKIKRRFELRKALELDRI